MGGSAAQIRGIWWTLFSSPHIVTKRGAIESPLRNGAIGSRSTVKSVVAGTAHEIFNQRHMLTIQQANFFAQIRFRDCLYRE